MHSLNKFVIIGHNLSLTLFIIFEDIPLIPAPLDGDKSESKSSIVALSVCLNLKLFEFCLLLILILLRWFFENSRHSFKSAVEFEDNDVKNVLNKLIILIIKLDMCVGK